MKLPSFVRPVMMVLAMAVPFAALGQSNEDMIYTWKSSWPKTDFSKVNVKLNEIISGGPPKDGIPPIDRPKFVSIADAAKWLGPKEPVMVYQNEGEAKAYPMQIMIWHEIVNDAVGGRPVAVTYCPLCNSAIVFDRTVDGRVLDFGTTGKLRLSDLVMWDRQTESWWQQLTGEGIVGTYTGTKLTVLPAAMVSFEDFRASFPGGKVLSRDTGFGRNYGSNPYVGYDAFDNTQPFLFKGKVDKRLTAMERVVALDFEEAQKAYPFAELAKGGPVNDEVAGRKIVVFYDKGTRSALDTRAFSQGRDVGAASVFSRTLDGKLLTFERRGGNAVDRETGSTWDMLGQAQTGPLKGKRLTPISYGNHFAFAWLSFRPGSTIWRAP